MQDVHVHLISAHFMQDVHVHLVPGMSYWWVKIKVPRMSYWWEKLKLDKSHTGEKS